MAKIKVPQGRVPTRPVVVLFDNVLVGLQSKEGYKE